MAKRIVAVLLGMILVFGPFLNPLVNALEAGQTAVGPSPETRMHVDTQQEEPLKEAVLPFVLDEFAPDSGVLVSVQEEAGDTVALESPQLMPGDETETGMDDMASQTVTVDLGASDEVEQAALLPEIQGQTSVVSEQTMVDEAVDGRDAEQTPAVVDQKEKGGGEALPLFGESLLSEIDRQTAQPEVDGLQAMSDTPFLALAAAPLSGSLEVDQSSIDAGEEVTATWSIFGGTAPYDVWLSWYTVDEFGAASFLESVGSLPANGSHAKRFTSSGQGYVSISVWDAKGGRFNKKSDVFTIVSTVEPLVCELSFSGEGTWFQPLPLSWQISGGTAPYTIRLVWSVYVDNDPKPVSEHIGQEAQGSASFTPTQGEKGIVEVYVTDAAGLTKYYQLGFDLVEGQPEPEPLACEIVLDKASVEVGSEISANWTVSGGVAPYQVSYQWETKDEDGEFATAQSGQSGLETGKATFTPSLGVNGRFVLIVKDAADISQTFTSDTFAITPKPIPPEPLVCEIVLDEASVEVESEISANWTVSGGVAPYQVSYQWETKSEDGEFAVAQSGESSLVSDKAMFSPSSGVNGRFVLTVTDAADASQIFTSDAFAITPKPVPPEPLACEIVLDKASVEVESKISATWTVSGGVAPYQVSYQWETKAEDGDFVVTQSGQSNLVSDKVVFSPSSGVNGRFVLTVIDAADVSQTFTSVTFTITPKPVPPEPLVCEIVLDKASVEVESEISANWTVSGGVAPYQVSYQWETKDEDGEFATAQSGGSDLDSDKATFSPSSGVNGRFVLTVTDTADASQTFISDTFAITPKPIPPEPLACEIVLDKDSVEIESEISANWLVSGGVAPYQVTYQWETRGENGEFAVVQSGQSSLETDKVVFSPSLGVNGRFVLTVKDATDISQTFTSDTFAITPKPIPPEPLECDIVLDMTSVEVESEISASWTVSGGVAPYQVTYQWETKGEGGEFSAAQSGQSDLETDKAVFSPSSGVNGRFVLTVTDAVDASQIFTSETFAITPKPIPPEPLTCEIVLDKASVEIESEISANWTVNGGVAPYQVSYQWETKAEDGDFVVTQSGQSNLVSDKVVFSPSSGVNGRFELTVTDASDVSQTFTSNTFAITPKPIPPDPLECEIVLDKASVEVESEISATWTVSGGVAPYQVTYQWETKGEGGEFAVVQSGHSGLDADKAVFSPASGVNGRFVLMVTDEADASQTFASETFTITTKPIPPEPLACEIALDKASVEIESEISASWSVSGGVGPYQVTYQWETKAADGDFVVAQSGESDLDSDKATFAPSSGVNGRFVLTVIDASDVSQSFTSDTFAITHKPTPPEPLACVIVLDKAYVEVESEISANWTVSGGVAPYQVSYQWETEEENGEFTVAQSGQSGLETDKATFSPSSGVNGRFVLTVTDAADASQIFTSETFIITPKPIPPEPLACEIVLDKASVEVESEISATWTVSGGVAPYHVHYQWETREENEEFAIVQSGQSGLDTDKAVFSASSGVNGRFVLKVVDSAQQSAEFQSRGFEIQHSLPHATALAGNGFVRLDWAQVPGATRYAVALYQSGRYHLLTTALTRPQYTALGLVNGQEYAFLVQALVNGRWSSDAQGLLVRATPKEAPTPRPVAMAVPEDGGVLLSWQEVPGATRYAVAMYQNQGYRLFSAAITGLSFHVAGLQNGEPAYFLVQAQVNGSWSSDDTQHLVSATPQAIPVPVPKVEASSGDGQVSLRWEAVPGASRYAVALRQGGRYQLLTSSLTDPAFTLSGLINGREYAFLVQAQVKGKWSSDDSSHLVNACPQGAPSREPLVKAQAGDGLVKLSFDAVPGASKYAVALYQAGVYRLLVSDLQATEYTARGLTNGVPHAFLVQAFTDGRWSSDSTLHLVVATPVALPVPVPQAQAQAGEGLVRLSWQAVPEAARYAVALWQNGRFTLLNADLRDTNYLALGLINGREYAFLVQAQVNGRWSSDSALRLVKATPNGTANLLPNPVVTPGIAKLHLSWQAVQGATKYAVATYQQGAYQLLDADITDTEYTVNGLKNGQSYSFLVQAFVSGRWTSDNPLHLVSATPQVPAPKVVATANDGFVILAWEPIPDASRYAVSVLMEDGVYKVLTRDHRLPVFTVTGLINGKTYRFLVQAQVQGFWSSDSWDLLVHATPQASAR